MRFLGWLVLALIGLVIAFIFFGFGYHKSIWYDLVPYRWYDEVVLDVTVEGERMQISATSECRWRHYVTMPDANRTGYKVTGGIVAKRLPSGAALVIRPGAFCHTGGRVKIEGIEGREGYYYANDIDYFHEGMWKPQPVTDAPLMLWLDDAENPTQIEAYVSLDYYEHPNARVKLHGFTRQAKRRGSVTDVRDEVPWLAKGNSFWSGLEDAETWIGHFYWAVPQSVWQKDVMFSPFAATISEAQFVKARPGLTDTQNPIDFRNGSVIPVFVKGDEAHLKVAADTPRGLVMLTKSAEVTRRRSPQCRGKLLGASGRLVRSASIFFIDGLQVPQLPKGDPDLEYAMWASLIFDPVSAQFMAQGSMCVTSAALVWN